MTDLFDAKGTFVALADDVIATMPPDIREAYAGVKASAELAKAADAELDAATKAVEQAVVAVADAQKRAPKPPSFNELVKSHIEGNRRH